MAAHLKVVGTLGTENLHSPQIAKSNEQQGDLSLRLMRAFRSISDHEDRLKVIRIAEALGDPIWDY
jgi:hypothetical protein